MKTTEDMAEQALRIKAAERCIFDAAVRYRKVANTFHGAESGYDASVSALFYLTGEPHASIRERVAKELAK